MFSMLSTLALQTYSTVQFEVSRAEDLEGGCSALFDKGMVPVRRLLESLGECLMMCFWAECTN